MILGVTRRPVMALELHRGRGGESLKVAFSRTRVVSTRSFFSSNWDFERLPGRSIARPNFLFNIKVNDTNGFIDRRVNLDSSHRSQRRIFFPNGIPRGRRVHRITIFLRNPLTRISSRRILSARDTNHRRDAEVQSRIPSGTGATLDWQARCSDRSSFCFANGR